ncbi:consortin, connexin sorting protein b [Gadus morhua]|uniref:Consortin, connexin sorting protein b n=1 Tax=Gadus morhua TaxID=8049 RepID=A0A8C5AUY7_GADMO|nr:consortin-like [Gadus morhua]XP_030201537.1 consortin-like [Gadus morhua]
MGNKNMSAPPKGPDAGGQETQEEQPSETSLPGPSERVGAPGPSPEVLASLHTLVEAPNYTLLPHSLHQMAEAYSLKDDYQWAIQFLQLEKSYHERLLANLAALEETWESQLEGQKDPEGTESNRSRESSMEALEQLCRNHSRPLSGDQCVSDPERGGAEGRALHHGENQTPPPLQHGADTKPPAAPTGEGLTHTEPRPPQDPRQQDEGTEEQQEEEEEEDEEQEERREGEEEEMEEEEERRGAEEEEEVCEEERRGAEEEEEPCEEGQEVACEEMSPEEEEVKGEWPTGVPQASEKDLVKLSHDEGCSAHDGLVSILKRRRASLDGLPPPGVSVEKHNGKRKVRFTEPEYTAEQDEAGGDSCLILLLLCTVTVVISIGGTALYCTLVDTYSSICTDFSDNINFYVVNVQRVFDQLKHLLPLQT